MNFCELVFAPKVCQEQLVFYYVKNIDFLLGERYLTSFYLFIFPLIKTSIFYLKRLFCYFEKFFNYSDAVIKNKLVRYIKLSLIVIIIRL